MLFYFIFLSPSFLVMLFCVSVMSVSVCLFASRGDSLPFPSFLPLSLFPLETRLPTLLHISREGLSVGQRDPLFPLPLTLHEQRHHAGLLQRAKRRVMRQVKHLNEIFPCRLYPWSPSLPLAKEKFTGRFRSREREGVLAMVPSSLTDHS